MSQLPRDLEAYYSRRALEYDRIYEKPERQADLQTLKHYVATHMRDRRVLEVACGTGYWTSLLATVAEAVLAVDVADATLDVARRRMAWPPAVRFARADAYALSAARVVSAGAPFTAALAGFWISHVPRHRLAAFLAQLNRTLSAHAVVVLFDNRFIAGSSTDISTVSSTGDTYQLRQLEDGSTFEVLKNFYQPDELLHAVASAGRADVRTTQLDLLPYYWVLRYTIA
jgi:ubiquinone/menaquinone biosynthesis C-methylase UbiE